MFCMFLRLARFTRVKRWQEGFALEQLNNLTGNRLKKVKHLIRERDKLQKLTETLQPLEFLVILK